MSKVFLVPGARTDSPDAVQAQIEALWRAAEFDALFKPNALAAIKLHVGEPGNDTFVSPAIARALVSCVAATGAHPYLTDTAVLYRSPRDNAVGHARVAHVHGFGIEAVGAPFIPADGLRGDEQVEVEINGKHFDTVAIASGILQAGGLVVLSHATGHLGTGLAATMKNLGMGCGSRRAKLKQHHGQQPRIDPEACTACGNCAMWCPAGAIAVDATAEIDPAVCIGCGECMAVCRDDAVKHDWSKSGQELQERMVEHAAGVVRGHPNGVAYFASAQTITKDCDCIAERQQPLVADIGLLASHDPVALDQAVLDLVCARAGQSLQDLAYPEHDPTVQLSYAEALGIGERDVELIELQT